MEIFSQSLQRLRAFLDLQFKGLNLMPIVVKNQQLDEVLIDEFNEIIEWLNVHLEVKFLKISLNLQETSIPNFLNEEQYLAYRSKCKKFFDRLRRLPQIVIIDFNGHFENIWCEFIYHGNYVLTHSETTFDWNHLQRGILPVSSLTFEQSTEIKNIILTSQKYIGKTLSEKIKFLTEYENDEQRKSLLGQVKHNIFHSSPSGIIQLKHAFSSNHQEHFEKIIHYSHLSSDWIDGKEKFSSVHEMKDLLARSNGQTTPSSEFLSNKDRH